MDDPLDCKSGVEGALEIQYKYCFEQCGILKRRHVWVDVVEIYRGNPNYYPTVLQAWPFDNIH
jgi:hypothetical protein